MTVPVRPPEAPLAPDPGRVVATGTLQEKPFSRLIIELHRRRLTSALVIVDESGDESRIFLREGVPVHVERPDETDRLHRVLSESNLVQPAVLDAARAQADGTGNRLGDLLVGTASITPKQLGEALKFQLRRKLQRIFFVRRGRFQILAGDHQFGVGAEFEAMRLDPRCLIYLGIRAGYDDARLREELLPIAGHRVKLVSMPAGLVVALGFPPEDPTIALLGRQATAVADLPPSGVKPQEGRAVLLALLYMDLLETVPVAQVTPPQAKAPVPEAVPQAPASIPSAPPRRPSAGVTIAGGDLKKRLQEIAAGLETLSHFELLGVSEAARPEEIGAAYLKGIRHYHPDRLASLSLRDLIPDAERVVARMGQAHATLSDPKAKAAYVASRRSGPVLDTGAAILAAEEHFTRGLALLRKGDMARAVEAFSDAIRGNPVEPFFKAHWAWARFEASAEPKDALARETAKLLDEALKERPRFPDGHYWRGLLCKLQGDMPAAGRFFREAVVQKPDFLEAQREARLIEMRRSRLPGDKAVAAARTGGTATKPATGGGLFDRFKKKG